MGSCSWSFNEIGRGASLMQFHPAMDVPLDSIIRSSAKGFYTELFRAAPTPTCRGMRDGIRAVRPHAARILFACDTAEVAVTIR